MLGHIPINALEVRAIGMMTPGTQSATNRVVDVSNGLRRSAELEGYHDATQQPLLSIPGAAAARHQ